jgi:hypothetical protein
MIKTLKDAEISCIINYYIESKDLIGGNFNGANLNPRHKEYVIIGCHIKKI